MNYVILSVFIKMGRRTDMWGQSKMNPSCFSLDPHRHLASIAFFSFWTELESSCLSFAPLPFSTPISKGLRACFPARWWGDGFGGSWKSSWKVSSYNFLNHIFYQSPCQNVSLEYSTEQLSNRHALIPCCSESGTPMDFV